MIHHSWWLLASLFCDIFLFVFLVFFFVWPDLFMCHGLLKCFLVGKFCFDAMHKNILILNDGPSGVLTDDRPRLVSVEF